MENNEIYIDGVNVAGCQYYHYKGCTANNLCKCDGNLNICKNCYYKQLKRLEFELKVTKADYEASEQENKELKEKIKELDKMTGIFSARLCNKYRSALEKIREDIKCFYSFEDSSNGYQLVTIIDKINEVLK